MADAPPGLPRIDEFVPKSFGMLDVKKRNSYTMQNLHNSSLCKSLAAAQPGRLEHIVPFAYSMDTARLVRVAESLGIGSDPDYDLAAHPRVIEPRAHAPYFAEWDFDLPSIGREPGLDEGGAVARATLTP